MSPETVGCGYCADCGYGGEPSDACLHKVPAGDPYVITSEHTAPKAYGTLGEARYAAGKALALVNTDGENESPTPHERTIIDEHVGEAGGNVVGLRRRVVKVRCVDWGELADLADAFIDGEIPDDPRERHAAILAAFNGED